MRDRRLTVTYSHAPPLRRNGYYEGDRKVPTLRLHGRWLREAGFRIGERVRIEVEEGRLIVVAEEQMSLVPREELARLKREISVERLVEARGVRLRRKGKDLLGLCPFHDDKEPSLGGVAGEEPLELPRRLRRRWVGDRLGDEGGGGVVSARRSIAYCGRKLRALLVVIRRCRSPACPQGRDGPDHGSTANVFGRPQRRRM